MKDADESTYYCISDFVAPQSSSKYDYIGMFGVSIFGAEQLCKQYEDNLDDYK